MNTKRLFYGFVFGLILLLALAKNGLADTPVSGPITSDTTWTLLGSPYIVIGDVGVMDGVTLTIEPGVEVRFDGWYKLEVLQVGTLYAVGTPNFPIILTSNQSSPNPGDWYGLLLQGDSTLKFCHVEYGVFNIQIYRSTSSTIENCIISDSSQDGIYVSSSSSVSIKYNTVVNTSVSSNGAGISVDNDSPEISYNTIVKNGRGINLLFLRSESPTIKNNTIFGNDRWFDGPYDILYCDSCSQYDNPSDTDATFNYWGQDTTAEMENEGCNSNIEKVYDWYDDYHLGKVDYCNWLSSPNEDSPISPPTGFQASEGNSIILNWTANPESDLAGYKVYYDIDSGRPYNNVVDVGNVTSYILTGLAPGTYYITVTAYDINADGLGDMCEGHESYYATEQEITVGGQIDPVPDIKANGLDGPATIPHGDLLTVTASLDPGSHDGEDADWWLAAASSFGLYWYTLDNGWVQSNTPIHIYEGPLFNLSPYTVLEMSTLPVGNYTFYFAVDDNMDGLLDATYLDSVLVNIQ